MFSRSIYLGRSAIPRRGILFTELLEQRRLLAMMDLDLWFGDAGVANPFPDLPGETAFAAEVEAGGILVAGTVYSESAGQWLGRVVRLNSTGALDATFGDAGIASTDFRLTHAALEPAGKLILTGSDTETGTLYVQRLNSDGTDDASFGTAGLVQVPLPPLSGLWDRDVAVGGDGKIIVLVNQYDENSESLFALVRLTAAGSLDPTFDGDGIANGPAGLYASVLAVQPDGKILVTGEGYRAARFTAAGAVDSTFGTEGIAGTRGGLGGSALLVQTDGKIVVGGWSYQEGEAGSVRLTTSGATDIELEDDGVSTYYEDRISDLLIDQDTGKILALKGQGYGSPAVVQRFNTNGTLDPTFNEGEMLVAGLGSLTQTFAGDLLLVQQAGGQAYGFGVERYGVRPDVDVAPNGTLVVTGTSGNDSITVRIDDNGSMGPWVLVNRNGTVYSTFHQSEVQRIDLKAGGGNDVVTCSLSVPTLVAAGLGNDSIATGSGNDTVDDGAGNDTINLGGGDDYISVAGGFDSVMSGLGNDLVYGGDYVDTGDGNDQILSQDFADADTSTPVTVNAGAGDDYIYLYNRPAVIAAGDGNDNVNARSIGDNTIDAGLGDDLVSTGEGDDTIHGGAGDDIVYASEGSDLISGGDGNDSLFAGGGDPGESNTIVGNAGNDRLFGSDGADLLVGNGGNDRIRGLGGADRLYGRAGIDRLYGDAGGDRIFGDDGNDFLLDGGPGNDRVYGGAGDDNLCGGSGNDELYCGGGADTLVGNKGDDTLSAADSVGDLLDGGKGNDGGRMDESMDDATSIEQVLT